MKIENDILFQLETKMGQFDTGPSIVIETTWSSFGFGKSSTLASL